MQTDVSETQNQKELKFETVVRQLQELDTEYQLQQNNQEVQHSNSIDKSIIRSKHASLYKQQSQKSLITIKPNELNISNPTQSEHQNKEQIPDLETHIKDQIKKYSELLQTRFTYYIFFSFRTQEKDQRVLKKLIKTSSSQLEKLKQEPVGDVSGFGGISILNELQIRQQIIPDQQGLSNSTRQKNLKKIYDFYCRLYYTRGNQEQFGRIFYESHILTEGKFNIFCRQFGILGIYYKNPQIYLDSNVHHKVENPIEVNSNPIDDTVNTHKWWLKKNYKEKVQRSPNETGMRVLQFKELNNLFRKHFNNQLEINFQQFQTILPKVAELMFFGNEDSLELLLTKVLQIDGLQFLKKMTNIHIPFNSQELDGFRQPQILKPLKGLTKEELMEKKIEISRWQDEKRKLLFDKLQQSMSTSKQISQIYQPSYFKSKDYRERGQKLANYRISEKGSLLDWGILEQIEYNQIISDDFKPFDLIEEQEDDDDRLYLKAYNFKQNHRKSNILEQQQQPNLRLL